MRKHVRTIALFSLKLAGTVLFLWWAFSQIDDKSTLCDSFHLALRSPYWVVAGLSLAFFTLLTSALRWHLLLRAQAIHQPFSYIFRLTLYGAFFNIASFGGAAGDAAKIVLLMRRVPDKKIGVTLSVMVDHIVGFLASSIIFLVFTWGFGTIGHVKNAAGRGTFVAATWFQAAALIGIVLSVVSCMPFMLTWGRKHLPRLTNNRWVGTITSILDLYRTRWHHALGAFLVSFVMAASFYLTFYAGLRTIDQPADAVTMMAVMPIVDVVTALPISISGLGVRERTFDFMLSELTGIPTSAAVAASIIGFLFNLFWGVVGGLTIIATRIPKKADEEPTLTREEPTHG